MELAWETGGQNKLSPRSLAQPGFWTAQATLLNVLCSQVLLTADAFILRKVFAGDGHAIQTPAGTWPLVRCQAKRSPLRIVLLGALGEQSAPGLPPVTGVCKGSKAGRNRQQPATCLRKAFRPGHPARPHGTWTAAQELEGHSGCRSGPGLSRCPQQQAPASDPCSPA